MTATVICRFSRLAPSPFRFQIEGRGFRKPSALARNSVANEKAQLRDKAP